MMSSGLAALPMSLHIYSCKTQIQPLYAIYSHDSAKLACGIKSHNAPFCHLTMFIIQAQQQNSTYFNRALKVSLQWFP